MTDLCSLGKHPNCWMVQKVIGSIDSCRENWDFPFFYYYYYLSSIPAVSLTETDHLLTRLEWFSSLSFNNAMFKLQGMFEFQTYPEEERPCLSKYWKIYFPDREISLALFFDYLFLNYL